MSIIKTHYTDQTQLINRMALFGYTIHEDYEIIAPEDENDYL